MIPGDGFITVFSLLLYIFGIFYNKKQFIKISKLLPVSSDNLWTIYTIYTHTHTHTHTHIYYITYTLFVSIYLSSIIYLSLLPLSNDT
jgi:hypothetical protein